MTQHGIINDYFEWLHDIVCRDRYSDKISYRKLLMYLHDTEFRYLILRDENWAEEGAYLRYRFGYDQNCVEEAERYLDGPCSVLEMMIALALHCEEHIMDNSRFGNRTGQWFWKMVVNLGLGSMTDNRFDKQYVADTVTRFLDREYDPDGRGGLFTVKNCDRDLRTVEIFYQMCWYLNTIEDFEPQE